MGTQINGAPHAGTSLVQSMAFATAARLHDRHSLPVEVRFSALDNAPHELVTDPSSGNRYQRAYAQALGTDGIARLVGTLYQPLFDALSERLAVPYGVENYRSSRRPPCSGRRGCGCCRVWTLQASGWLPPRECRTCGCPARIPAGGRRKWPPAARPGKSG
ncbi:hypothetical protein [Streptomyces purpurascens]|uniref:hypothetical protein n=1 Tax=Streptomyces purpurascens TaxID=1924 RepID=UPI0019C5A296|nr:hypothetical protein [Streptomyces purpurascens]GHA17544.1 hypothetical protein GCM10010303_29480 [Streptomyces purpurascens]